MAWYSEDDEGSEEWFASPYGGTLQAYLPKDSHHPRQLVKASSDSALMREIEALKQQIKEQSNTFQGHQAEMTKLQEKLAELQKRQAELRKSEPPPAYVPKAPITFLEPKSRACTIL